MRVIAATSRNLKTRIAEGAFREDLYFRLNVITAEMPPLRQRSGDLIRFAEHYIKHFSNLAEAAQVLGIDQATLYRQRKKMGLE